jgi:hypothetical protein
METSSCSRAAIGAMARIAGLGLGLRITIAGIRTPLSVRASRRSRCRKQCAARKRMKRRRVTRRVIRLEDHVEALIAGGNWNNGTNCGSRSRNANNYRWNTNTNIGARFASDTGMKLATPPGWIFWPCLRNIQGQNTQRRLPATSSASENCRQ